MYTGTADHSLTAELVSLVDVPVIASGDVTSHARAKAVLATTGASAVMVGRAAQGNPWALREIVGEEVEPTREEIVAELLLFMRETVRELGEFRATGFLKKFYGWYLGRGRFPRPFKQELVMLPTLAEVETRLLAAAPGAADVLERLEAGSRGRRRGAARLAADLDLRRRLKPLSPGRFRSQTSRRPWSVSSGSTSEIVCECGAISSARPPVAIAIASGAPSSSRMRLDDRVDLACEAVDHARLERRGRRLADHVLGRGERHPGEPGGAREQRVHRDLDAGREHAAHVLARGRDDVEVRRGAEVDHDRRRAPALARGDRVRDPVGADLARVVVADRHARRDARAEHEQLGARPAIGEALVLALQRRHRRSRARSRRARRARRTRGA